MAVPTQLSDLSETAASNSPAGTDTVGTTMDDFIRAHASIIARISAGTDALATPALGAATATTVNKITFTQPATGATVTIGNGKTLTVNGNTTLNTGISDTATAVALSLSGSGANSVTIANSATNPTIGTSAGCLNLSAGLVHKIVVNSAATLTIDDTHYSILQTVTASVYTLPTASSYTGRIIKILNVFGGAITSAASDVQALIGGATGTAIVAATAGKWVELQSTGTSWHIIAAN